MMDYHKCLLSTRERIWLIGKEVLEVLFLDVLYFRSLWGVIFLIPYGVWKYLKAKEQMRGQRLHILRMEFKEVMISIAFSLRAGYSLENAISISKREFEQILPKELEQISKKGTSPMCQELSWMEHRMKLGESIGELFLDLAKRTGLEEVHSYAEVLTVAKKQGGNLVYISQTAAGHIGRCIQAKEETEQILAGKQLEKRIMLFMPHFIVAYLQMTNPSYMEPLFITFQGRILMGVCLCLVFVAQYWADRIALINI